MTEQREKEPDKRVRGPMIKLHRVDVDGAIYESWIDASQIRRIEKTIVSARPMKTDVWIGQEGLRFTEEMEQVISLIEEATADRPKAPSYARTG